MTPELIAELREAPPILVWIDCDYYSSARSVLERLLPVLPSGCVLYFDVFDLNYGSRLTGEARLVHEMNHGAFGDDLELVLDTDLSWNSRRIYRFVRLDGSRRNRDPRRASGPATAASAARQRIAASLRTPGSAGCVTSAARPRELRFFRPLVATSG